jgi:hypothetical protein
VGTRARPAVNAASEEAVAARLAQRAVTATKANEAHTLDSAARLVANKSHKHRTKFTLRELRDAVPYARRSGRSIEEIVAYAEAREWVLVDGNGWLPGPKRPR